MLLTLKVNEYFDFNSINYIQNNIANKNSPGRSIAWGIFIV
ncbi:Uncharacterised protein [Chryseobacterium nakagawai]|nr:Uncharacterised protein [Chryseobacterium nakagawai]